MREEGWEQPFIRSSQGLRRSLIRRMCDLPHTHFGRLPNPWFHTYYRKGLSSLEPHQTLLVSNYYVTTPTRPLMQSENQTGQREEEKKKKPPIQEGR